MPSFRRIPQTVIYRHRLDAALRAGELEEAELCAERLVRDSKGNPRYLFTYACIVFDRGDRAHCLAVMRRLAPPDSAGYGPAQLWLAQRLLTQKEISLADQKEIEGRLLFASKDEASAQAARAILLRYYCGTGQPGKAEDQYGASAGSASDSQLKLALAFAVNGDRAKSQKYAALARSFYSDLCKNEPDNASARLDWAQAATLLDDFPAAVSILQDGYQLTHAPGYRISLGRLFYNWSNSFSGSTEHLLDRIVLLGRSVECDDSSRLFLRTLVEIAPINRPDAKEIRDKIDKLIAEKNSPAILQIFLGVDCLLKKDQKEAARRFDLAQAANPDSPRILNNIAWTMSNTQPERLALALDLMMAAVRQAPTEQRFLGTRGQVFVKLERWADAMSDLEKAIKVTPDNKELQDALARASTELQKPVSKPSGQQTTR